MEDASAAFDEEMHAAHWRHDNVEQLRHRCMQLSRELYECRSHLASIYCTLRQNGYGCVRLPNGGAIDLSHYRAPTLELVPLARPGDDVTAGYEEDDDAGRQWPETDAAPAQHCRSLDNAVPRARSRAGSQGKNVAEEVLRATPTMQHFDDYLNWLKVDACQTNVSMPHIPSPVAEETGGGGGDARAHHSSTSRVHSSSSLAVCDEQAGGGRARSSTFSHPAANMSADRQSVVSGSSGRPHRHLLFDLLHIGSGGNGSPTGKRGVHHSGRQHASRASPPASATRLRQSGFLMRSSGARAHSHNANRASQL